MEIKTFLLSLFFLVAYVTASAQLKRTMVCPDINIDILDGIVNKTLLPNSTPGLIEKVLPCFTAAEPVGTNAKCGAGVFYKDKDVYFYTDRNYIEIGPAFKGKLSLPLMGARRNGLFNLLGSPQVKDVHWDAYQTSYGIIILNFNSANRVDKIQFSTQNANSIQLCQ
jgi:hypothetical protein